MNALKVFVPLLLVVALVIMLDRWCDRMLDKVFARTFWWDETSILPRMGKAMGVKWGSTHQPPADSMRKPHPDLKDFDQHVAEAMVQSEQH